MSLDALKEILLPPDAPQETGDPDRWTWVEHMAGAPLPADYRAFIRAYGTGCIGDFLYIWNPFSKHLTMNLLTRLSQGGWEYDERALPYPFHPKQPGLLPFGTTKNGDTLCFVTQGNPDAWTIFVLDARSPDYDEYAVGLADFLVKMLRDEFTGNVFGSDLIQQNAPFTNPFKREMF